jgi:hypothetical protein
MEYSGKCKSPRILGLFTGYAWTLTGRSLCFHLYQLRRKGPAHEGPLHKIRVRSAGIKFALGVPTEKISPTEIILPLVSLDAHEDKIHSNFIGL